LNLKEFIERHGSALVQKIEQNMTPLYNPLQPEGVEEFEKKISTLLRKPFPVQAEIIKGLSKALYKEGRGRLFVSGEMGSGKTTIALSTIAMAYRPLRVLVLCPTHLVGKWMREAKETIPGVKVVDLAVKEVISILDSLRYERNKNPETTEIFVISKERCKLSYGWRAAAMPGKWLRSDVGRKNFERSPIPRCPRCGVPAMEQDKYLSWDVLAKRKCRCSSCGEPLWQADSKLRRYAPAEFIKKYLKGFFDLIVVDEVHDYKAGDSLQGNAMGQVLSAAKKVLCLTGTLNGGYADDLFYLLYRLEPDRIKEDGFQHKESTRWLETYGTLERIQKIDEEDKYFGRARKNNVIVRKRPGVSPVVIGKFLLDKTAFIRLSDVIEGLPPYEENVVSVKTMDEQFRAYKKLENQLAEAVHKYKTRALGAMLQSLLSYPDSCVLYPERVEIKNRQTGEMLDVIEAPLLAVDGLLPKEEELVRLCKQEKKQGRKVLCYLTFTGTRDLRPRLESVLKQAGFKVGVLDASVEPKKREVWINKHAKNIDVLLVNAELVKTGLDLYDFPTVCFYQVGYNIFTLRQAARRSWRIGQTKPVRVYFFCYQNTMQETALTLIAKKLEVALMVEGDLPEGLAEYAASGDSIIEEMGKALVEGGNYGGAEKAWANFRKKEVEAQLGINGKETIFTEKTNKTTARIEPIKKTTINENVVVKVTVIEGKKKRQSTMEVKYGDLDLALQGKVAQFAMF
jgi:SNF2 family DNA or RNA helicase